MSDTTEDEQHARPFVDFLNELRYGAVTTELTDELHQLIAAVKETRKAGRLTLTLELNVQKNTDMLVIKDSVTSKTPRLERPASLWYVDPSGNATRNDPNQLEFTGIRVIDDEKEAKRA